MVMIYPSRVVSDFGGLQSNSGKDPITPLLVPTGNTRSVGSRLHIERRPLHSFGLTEKIIDSAIAARAHWWILHGHAVGRVLIVAFCHFYLFRMIGRRFNTLLSKRPSSNFEDFNKPPYGSPLGLTFVMLSGASRCLSRRTIYHFV